jgi:hypothetical protein
MALHGEIKAAETITGKGVSSALQDYSPRTIMIHNGLQNLD